MSLVDSSGVSLDKSHPVKQHQRIGASRQPCRTALFVLVADWAPEES